MKFSWARVYGFGIVCLTGLAFLAWFDSPPIISEINRHTGVAVGEGGVPGKHSRGRQDEGRTEAGCSRLLVSPRHYLARL